jgi:phospholipase/lecithinase/hemolysin
MRTFQRTMAALLALLPLAVGTAFADSDHGYSRIFVFGDSLSDPGNNFAVTGATSHPPFDPLPVASYGVGGHHYLNGRTWIEYLAQEMGLTKWAKPAYRDPAFGNYAYAYARARPFSPVAPSLGEQVQAWSQAGYCTGAAMNETLFVLQIGGNDVADAMMAYGMGQDPMAIFEPALYSIGSNIGYLAGCGGRNFMIANVPNFGVTPYVIAQGEEAAAGASAMSAMFNHLLQTQVIDNLPDDLNVSVVDFYGISSAVTAMPEAFGFTDVTTPCLTFGVTENAFCEDRDGHLFWDVLHINRKAHAMIAAIVIEQLPVPD